MEEEEANSCPFFRGGLQVAIGARIVSRDGRGLRCVLWYVCLYLRYRLKERGKGYSEEVEVVVVVNGMGGLRLIGR